MLPPRPRRTTGRRLLTVVITAVTLGMVLTSCGDAPEASGKKPKPTYVALGDSYTAAPGIGITTGTDGCYGSYENYPHLVAEEMGYSLEDRSCMAASTKAITGQHKTLTGQMRPPQINEVTHSTDLVTVGIGANDFKMFEIIASVCPRYGLGLAKGDTTSAPCTDAHKALPRRAGLDWRLPKVGPRVTKILQEIRQRSPEARVLVIGYPAIVPKKRTCKALVTAQGDLPLLNRFVDGLNKQLSTAARKAGATYIDVQRATKEHHICASDPWVAGFEEIPGKGVPWHPYEAEQQAVARLISTALKEPAA